MVLPGELLHSQRSTEVRFLSPNGSLLLAPKSLEESRSGFLDQVLCTPKQAHTGIKEKCSATNIDADSSAKNKLEGGC
jgi:hypothetical protein